jgi:hypothetical protein
VLPELITEDEPEPHPEWAAAQQPAPADIMMWAELLGGMCPATPYLGAAYFGPVR